MVTASGQASRRRSTAAVWRVPRTRGAISGTLLVLLGIWGGLIPFIGPQFHYAYTPDETWTMTAGRLWLEVVPAAATVLGGLILLGSASRVASLWAGWLAALGGAWFVVGPTLSTLWSGGRPQTGVPTAGNTIGNAVTAIGFFYGLGAVILFLAATALGRVSVIGVRDARIAEANELRAAPDEAIAPADDAAPVDEPTTGAHAATDTRAADRPLTGSRRTTDDRAVDDGTITDRGVEGRTVGNRLNEDRTVGDPTIDDRERTTAMPPADTSGRTMPEQRNLSTSADVPAEASGTSTGLFRRHPRNRQ